MSVRVCALLVAMGGHVYAPHIRTHTFAARRRHQMAARREFDRFMGRPESAESIIYFAFFVDPQTSNLFSLNSVTHIARGQNAWFGMMIVSIFRPTRIFNR
jgi:hypothetical protein